MFKFIATFSPALAVMYNLWSISLRLSFIHSHYAFNNSANICFLVFDIISDFIIYFELFLQVKQWRNKKRKVIPSNSLSQLSDDDCSSTFHDVLFRLQLQQSVNINKTNEEEATTNEEVSSIKTQMENLYLIVIVLSVLPFDYIWNIAFSSQNILYRLNRLIFVLLKTHKIYSNILSYLKAMRYIMNSGIQRAITLFITIAVVGHLFACVWLYVATESCLRGQQNWAELNRPILFSIHYKSHSEVNNKETSSAGIVLHQSWGYCYLRSFYWAIITIITTGYGDIVATNSYETYVAIVTMYIGFILCTFSIANLTLLFLNLDQSSTDYQVKMEALKTYMCKHRSLKNKLKHRILAIHEYQFETFKGMKEQDILNELPTTLKQKISNHISRTLLKRMFGCLLNSSNGGDNYAFLNSLVLSLESMVFAPQDVIVEYNSYYKKLFLISKGVAQMYQMDSENGNKIKVVKLIGNTTENDENEEEETQVLNNCDHCIGLISLTSQSSKSIHQIEAKTYLEAFKLEKLDYLESCRLHLSLSQYQTMEQNVAMIHSTQLKLFGKMSGGVNDEREKIIKNKVQWWRKHLLPKSLFRKCWSLFLCFGWIYYCFSTPLWLSCAYPFIKVQNSSLKSILLSVSYMIDICFIIDLLLRFTFFYFENNCGETIRDPEKIRNKFMQEMRKGHNSTFKSINHNSLKCEFLMNFPFDLTCIIIGSKYCAICRGFKVFRVLFSYQYLFQNMKYHMGGSSGDHHFKLIFSFSSKLKLGFSFFSVSMKRFLKLNLALMLLCHWVACLFILVGRISQSDDIDSWIESDETDERFYFKATSQYEISPTLYLRSIYWALVGMSTGMREIV